MTHPFRSLINNENILKKHVTIYRPPKIQTEKQIEQKILKGLNQKKKLELKRVHIHK